MENWTDATAEAQLRTDHMVVQYGLVHEVITSFRYARQLNYSIQQAISHALVEWDVL